MLELGCENATVGMNGIYSLQREPTGIYTPIWCTALREGGASRLQGDLIEGPPETYRTSPLYGTEGLKGGGEGHQLVPAVDYSSSVSKE